jgi:hypothetical protein
MTWVGPYACAMELKNWLSVEILRDFCPRSDHSTLYRDTPKRKISIQNPRVKWHFCGVSLGVAVNDPKDVRMCNFSEKFFSRNDFFLEKLWKMRESESLKLFLNRWKSESLKLRSLKLRNGVMAAPRRRVCEVSIVDTSYCRNYKALASIFI